MTSRRKPSEKTPIESTSTPEVSQPEKKPQGNSAAFFLGVVCQAIVCVLWNYFDPTSYFARLTSRISIGIFMIVGGMAHFKVRIWKIMIRCYYFRDLKIIYNSHKICKTYSSRDGSVLLRYIII
jgi:hypothetical protein